MASAQFTPWHQPQGNNLRPFRLTTQEMRGAPRPLCGRECKRYALPVNHFGARSISPGAWRGARTLSTIISRAPRERKREGRRGEAPHGAKAFPLLDAVCRSKAAESERQENARSLGSPPEDHDCAEPMLTPHSSFGLRPERSLQLRTDPPSRLCQTHSPTNPEGRQIASNVGGIRRFGRACHSGAASGRPTPILTNQRKGAALSTPFPGASEMSRRAARTFSPGERIPLC